MGPRFNTGSAPVKAVVSTLDESETLDRLECGHWVKRTFRDGWHIVRRRCASCPAILQGERTERVRSQPRSR